MDSEWGISWAVTAVDGVDKQNCVAEDNDAGWWEGEGRRDGRGRGWVEHDQSSPASSDSCMASKLSKPVEIQLNQYARVSLEVMLLNCCVPFQEEPPGCVYLLTCGESLTFQNVRSSAAYRRV